MAITFATPRAVGGTYTVARKTKIIIDPAGTIDIELTCGNYDEKGILVPVVPTKVVWANISSDAFFLLAQTKPDAAKTLWDNISDLLDSYITAYPPKDL